MQEFQKAKNLFVAGFQGLTVSSGLRVEAERSGHGFKVQGRQEHPGPEGFGRYVGGTDSG